MTVRRWNGMSSGFAIFAMTEHLQMLHQYMAQWAWIGMAESNHTDNGIESMLRGWTEDILAV